MTDKKYIPTEEQKATIRDIEQGMRKSEEIYEKTQKLEMNDRILAEGIMEWDLGEEGVV